MEIPNSDPLLKAAVVLALLVAAVFYFQVGMTGEDLVATAR